MSTAIVSTGIPLTELATHTRRDESERESNRGFYAKLELCHIPSGEQITLPDDKEYDAAGLQSELVSRQV